MLKKQDVVPNIRLIIDRIFFKEIVLNQSFKSNFDLFTRISSARDAKTFSLRVLFFLEDQVYKMNSELYKKEEGHLAYVIDRTL